MKFLSRIVERNETVMEKIVNTEEKLCQKWMFRNLLERPTPKSKLYCTWYCMLHPYSLEIIRLRAQCVHRTVLSTLNGVPGTCTESCGWEECFSTLYSHCTEYSSTQYAYMHNSTKSGWWEAPRLESSPCFGTFRKQAPFQRQTMEYMDCGCRQM